MSIKKIDLFVTIQRNNRVPGLYFQQCPVRILREGSLIVFAAYLINFVEFLRNGDEIS